MWQNCNIMRYRDQRLARGWPTAGRGERPRRHLAPLASDQQPALDPPGDTALGSVADRDRPELEPLGMSDTTFRNEPGDGQWSPRGTRTGDASFGG
jgi:hypothetical protein